MRSGLEAPEAEVDAGFVLDGLLGGAECEPPKKSKPKSESPPRVGLDVACAATAGGACVGLDATCACVVAGTGSPKRSTSGTAGFRMGGGCCLV